MALKKSELYSSLWSGCDELRGGMDASGGYSASRDQLPPEGHCYLHYGDIHKTTKTFVDVRAEHQDMMQELLTGRTRLV